MDKARVSVIKKGVGDSFEIVKEGIFEDSEANACAHVGAFVALGLIEGADAAGMVSGDIKIVSAFVN